MRRRISIFSLCVAWLCANGALSHITPIFACAQLIINFSHHLPAAQALVKTADGCHECAICLAVEHAEEEARKHPVPPENAHDAKLQLAFAVVTEIPFLRIPTAWLPPAGTPAIPRTEQVLLQPPRRLS